MIPQKSHLTESSQPYIPSVQPTHYIQQQGMPHPVTTMFQQYAHMGYMPQVAPVQMVSQWQQAIIGYRTEMVQGPNGVSYPQNVPVYGPPQLVQVPMPMPNFYQPNNYYADEYYADDYNGDEYYAEEYNGEEPTGEISNEVNQEDDLTLPQDIVGHAVETQTNSVALNSLTTTSPEVEQFFTPQEIAKVKKHVPRKQRSPAQLLNQFVKAAQSNTVKVDRPDYQQMISAYQQDQTNPAKWEAAMLHDVPPALLKNLKNITYFVRPKEESKKGKTTFLFPCSITCNGNMSTKTVAENKDKMCLELTLLQSGKAVHMFLRPLKSDDRLRDRVLGEKREQVEQKLHETLFPSLSAATNHKEKVKPASKTNKFVDDGIYLNFWSPYGVTIKAEKR